MSVAVVGSTMKNTVRDCNIGECKRTITMKRTQYLDLKINLKKLWNSMTCLGDKCYIYMKLILVYNFTYHK